MTYKIHQHRCEFTIDRLKNLWISAGILPGNTVLLHSDIKRILRFMSKNGLSKNPNDILESFISALGPYGTLLLPTFNIKITDPVYFDINNTPSRMGVLSEIARRDCRFVRSSHPLLSFVASGPRASYFLDSDDFTGIGENSIFAKLLSTNSTIAILGLPENRSMSFYHHVEYVHKVPYRWIIPFDSIIRIDSQTIRRKHGFYARRRDDGVITAVDRMGDHLWSLGLYNGVGPFVDHGLRTISAQSVFYETAKIIKADKARSYLYEISK